MIRNTTDTWLQVLGRNRGKVLCIAFLGRRREKRRLYGREHASKPERVISNVLKCYTEGIYCSVLVRTKAGKTNVVISA